jgi:hypothetical protein
MPGAKAQRFQARIDRVVRPATGIWYRAADHQLGETAAGISLHCLVCASHECSDPILPHLRR